MAAAFDAIDALALAVGNGQHVAESMPVCDLCRLAGVDLDQGAHPAGVH